MTTTDIRAAIYARVSSTGDRQSTERQVIDLKDYANKNEMTICKTFEEHISGDSGYFRLAGACHEYSVASLNMKNFTSPTPRNCVRKALIFALNDSAEALVSLSSK